MIAKIAADHKATLSDHFSIAQFYRLNSREKNLEILSTLSSKIYKINLNLMEEILSDKKFQLPNTQRYGKNKR
jgi:hypothetical protein